MARSYRTLAIIAAASLTVALNAQSVPPTAPASHQQPGHGGPSYTLFESGQVRPLALSPDRSLLFAVNTPDNRLEVLRVTQRRLTHIGSVPVGLEPVAVAARTDCEIWVVNHVSDSVSVVRLHPDHCGQGRPTGHAPATVAGTRHTQVGRVVRTLLVGDEPRDIVFAGPRHERAFVTSAHRGQNAPFDPQLTSPGIGRADVWVFNAEALGQPLGGTPIAIVNLFTDTPRALAASPDGSTVYAAGFHTGNRTTTIVSDVVTARGGVPPPLVTRDGDPQPQVGLIVKFDGRQWTDELGRSWNDQVKFALPDKDVFAIDAAADPPRVTGSFAGVGTVVYNLAVNPVNGDLFASNTDALNDRRFSGPGHSAPSVRGHFHESRITLIRQESVEPRHLNKHIDYSVCCAAIPNDEQARSLALPQGMAVSGDGRTLYVAALGSDKIGVFATAQLAADTFFPDVTRQIAVKGGPTGLVLDEPNRRLYVFTRFDNSVAVIDTRLLSETSRVPLYSPEPDEVITGRRLLYDASFTSSHGDSACASCHVFGDLDSLAWDLGDPDGMTIRNPAPFVIHPNDLCGPLIAINCGADGRPISPNFHPMKGPMTTQSLRGLANHGSMHWRGDRTGGNDAPNVQPDGGTYDERAAFTQFNAAFVDLLGRSRPLATAEMRALTDFVLQMAYPPNPIRRLDNSLTQEQQAGRDFYFGPVSDTFTNCNDCHRLDPQGNRQFGVTRPGFFGADGRTTDDAEFQVFKVPHLRNMYQKVGMFGMARSKFFLPDSFEPEVDNAFMGDQIRGFGFKHDGSVDTVFHLNRAIGFAPRAAGTAGPGDPGNPHGIPLTESGVELNRQIEAFMMAFDTNMPPIVGQQVTLTGDGTDAVRRRIDLLMQQADRGECDLVVKGGVHAAQSSYLYVGGGRFRPDRRAAPLVGDDDLRARAMTSAGELTYTCTPPGSGIRMGLDRDEDGFFDSDETTAGSRSDDPLSHPRR